MSILIDETTPVLVQGMTGVVSWIRSVMTYYSRSSRKPALALTAAFSAASADPRR